MSIVPIQPTPMPLTLAQALGLKPGQALPVWRAVGTVRAGFPSPAMDHQADRLDVAEWLEANRPTSFFMKLKGDSMRDMGLLDGDMLVVVKREARHGNVVVAVLDGEFTVKVLHKRGGRVRLKAANPVYPDIVPAEGQTLQIWGVVTGSCRAYGA